jgi:4-carboxymuconolactone decarboxylase
MDVPSKAEVAEVTREVLAGLSVDDPELLVGGMAARTLCEARSGLDPKTFSLVKIAALIAVDAPAASYMWQVANGLAAGCTPREILGVLQAIAPQVGGPKAAAAAPEMMVALGLAR